MFYFLIIFGIAILLLFLFRNRLLGEIFIARTRGNVKRDLSLKKRQLIKDEAYLYGWHPEIVRRLFPTKLDSLKHNKLERIYDITVDGFADKFVLGEKINDKERKAFWTLKLPKTDVSVFVKVEFEVVSEKDFRNYAEVDERYDPNSSLYRVSYGSFCFNSYSVHETIYEKHGLKTPFLSIGIILLPNEWENIKECLLLARMQSDVVTMTIKVEYPVNPEPETVIEEIILEGYSDKFQVIGFCVDSLMCINQDNLSRNMAFRGENWF